MSSTAARSLGAALVVAAAIFWIAFDGGSYGLTERASLAIVLSWVIAVAIALGLWPRARVPAAALVTGSFVAAFVAWTGLSTLWAESAERTLAEFNRGSLYLAVFALAILAAERTQLIPWLAGLAVATTAIGLVALAGRLFPDLAAESAHLAQLFPAAEKRLSYPVNYWNGLATLTAFAFPLLLFLAISLRSVVARGLALAPIPALAGTVYLTSSRGGTLAAALSVAVFIALAGRRWAAAAASLWAGAGVAGVIALLAARPELVDTPFESPLSEGQGRSAAVLIVLVCLATGFIWSLASRFAPSPPRLHRTVRVALLAVLVAGIAAGVAAADPRERFQRFKDIPPGLAEASVQEHLFSGSGNGRWQLWEVALDEFERHPILGRGAGTYEASWAEHATLDLFVRDAHSLYLETLAELGPVGFTLLIGLLASGVVAGARRLLGREGDDRTALAALLAVLAAYAFEAGFDWMWELTAVSVIAFITLGLLTGPATADPPSGPPRRATLPRVGAAAAGLVLLLTQVVPLFAHLQVRASQDAAAAGAVDEAVDKALAARELAPWAATPRLQLALAQELGGDLAAARGSIAEAVDRDPTDWRLWLVAARLETKAGNFELARRDLERAEELNPRSRLFSEG